MIIISVIMYSVVISVYSGQRSMEERRSIILISLPVFSGGLIARMPRLVKSIPVRIYVSSSIFFHPDLWYPFVVKIL